MPQQQYEEIDPWTVAYDIDERHRPLDVAFADSLTDTIKADGRLINPITVTLRDGAYKLVAGLHRLTAVRSLRWPTIPAIVLDVDAREAEILEIRENLARCELSAAQRMESQRRLRELIPDDQVDKGGRPKRNLVEDQTGAETARKNASSSGHAKPPRISGTAKAISKATGIPVNRVVRDITATNKIPDVKRLTGTSLDKDAELDALAKLPDAQRSALIEDAIDGRAVSAVAVAKAVKQQPEHVVVNVVRAPTDQPAPKPIHVVIEDADNIPALKARIAVLEERASKLERLAAALEAVGVSARIEELATRPVEQIDLSKPIDASKRIADLMSDDAVGDIDNDGYIDQARVKEIAASMAANGQYRPVVVIAHDNREMGFVVVDGWHRVYVAKQILKWPALDAIVITELEAYSCCPGALSDERYAAIKKQRRDELREGRKRRTASN